MMERGNSTTTSSATAVLGLGRTKSEQLVESSMMMVKSSPASSEHSAEGSSTTVSRKSSRRQGNKNTHIRKSRSAQMKIEVDELCNTGAALSRASSASLGLSFSFTGFTMPPETSDSKPFSDDDFILEDIEAGTRTKFQTEPTLPIYLKGKDEASSFRDQQGQ